MIKWVKKLFKAGDQEQKQTYQQFEEVDGHYKYIAQDGSVIYFKKSEEEKM
ncbi:hypothetical protein ABE073_04625 [Lederbergia citrisecunda]|uniref:hypothetical protein n=1 Tax=Lederbergia citrisecunda TaxID=2833583 RepID=UPI003D2804C3